MDVHVFYNGVSNDLDLAVEGASDSQVRDAVSEELGVNRSKLDNFVVDWSEDSVTVRPQASFG